MTLQWVATVSGDKKYILGQDESTEIKGGEKFVTFSVSEAEQILKHRIVIGPDGKPDLSEHDLDVITEYRNMDRELSQMSPRNQRRYLKKLKKDASDKRRQSNEARREIAKCEQRLEQLHKFSDTWDEIKAWASGPLTLEKPPGTMFHKLIDQANESQLIIVEHLLRKRPDDSKELADSIVDASVFVIEHNWAGAFRNAKDYVGGEYRLPDDVCAFEFRISGRQVIAIAFEMDNRLLMQPLFLMSNGWVVPTYVYKLEPDDVWHPHQVGDGLETHDMLTKLVDLIGQQIRAVAIALDAAVARSIVVKPDHKLNRARERRGDIPIYQYHVVSLANRQNNRPLPVKPTDHDIASRALHFVRPHRRNVDRSDEASIACEAGGAHTWSPYDNDSRSTCSKCEARSRRIEWHLRGDPDLGFIDKHYKL